MRSRLFLALVLVWATIPILAQQRTISSFFDEFPADWIRNNPNQAVSTRYFTGAEQDRLEQQLTPETLEYRRNRIQLARRGLAELRKFDRARMTPDERVSADLMQWQLDMVSQGEAFLDYAFP